MQLVISKISNGSSRIQLIHRILWKSSLFQLLEQAVMTPTGSNLYLITIPSAASIASSAELRPINPAEYKQRLKNTLEQHWACRYGASRSDGA